MSSTPPPTSATNISAPVPPPPPIPPFPPPGTNFIASIEPSLHDLIIGHTFLMIIFTLFLAMFYFSSPQARRKPLFLLTAFTVLLALASGVVLDFRAMHTILSPTLPLAISIDLAIGILGAVQSILIDTILLVRLLSINPLSFIGLTRFVSISILPITLKFLRVINLLVFIVVLAQAAKGGGEEAQVQLGIVWAEKPYLKIEWVAQVVDNTYASTLFLWRLYTRNKNNTDSSVVTNSRVSFHTRIQILFWIASTNFVFPVIFSIVQLVVVLKPNVDVAAVNDVVLVNTSVAVIGVVFAIAWAGSVSWERRRETVGFGVGGEDSDGRSGSGRGRSEKSRVEGGIGYGGRGVVVSKPVFALPVASQTGQLNSMSMSVSSFGTETKSKGSVVVDVVDRVRARDDDNDNSDSTSDIGIGIGDSVVPMPDVYTKGKMRGAGVGVGVGGIDHDAGVAVTTVSVHSSGSTSGSGSFPSLVDGRNLRRSGSEDDKSEVYKNVHVQSRAY